MINSTRSGGTLDPKKQAQMAKFALRQVLGEPLEIVKNAGEQISGQRVDSITPEQTPQQQPIPKASIEERNKKRRLEAFRGELDEIQQIQKRREQERQQAGLQEESEKKNKEEQAQNQPPPELEGKRPRGVMFGMAGAIKRKQNRVETQKTPSN